MITLDAGQEKVAAAFSRLQQELMAYQGLRTRVLTPPKGIYCYGSVGRGKTLLMDQFFQGLNREDKLRIHFHAFMKMIHAKLHERRGQREPLRSIARELAKKTKILCLDEMMVDDVADAMILANLLKALHRYKVVLVFTSNTAPENLYKNGVQRQNFIPAIQLIQQKTQVISIEAGEDYRLKTLAESGVYFTPLTEENSAKIKNEFERLSNQHFETAKVFNIQGHDFNTLACAHKMVWFSFHELCEKPRAYTDYLALTEQFKTFFVTQMPICYAKDDAAARRFVHLIDILYDTKSILILSAQTDIHSLYQGKDLKNEFTRTQSRLQEMQTPDYWAKK